MRRITYRDINAAINCITSLSKALGIELSITKAVHSVSWVDIQSPNNTFMAFGSKRGVYDQLCVYGNALSFVYNR